jgi:outer membrane protein
MQIPAAANASGPIAPGQELTLVQAITIALKYHPRIKEAAENTNAAKFRVGEARAFLGPQVLGVGQDLGSSFNGIANTSYYNPEAAFPRMTGRNHDLSSNDFAQNWDTGNNYMAGVAVSQFLLDFGRRRGFVAERRFEAAAAASSEEMTKLDLVFEVSQRYFEVLQAKELIGVYEKAVEQRDYHLHEAQVKAAAGLRPQLDVYVTQAEVERAQLHLIDAKNAYSDAKAALNNALGLSDRAPEYHLADVLTYSNVTEKLQPLLATAMRQRPDLKALNDQARAMGARIVQYKSDYLPTVNAMGGYSAMGTGLPAANNFNVGLVITWPIFNSFLTTNQLSETKAQERAIQDGIQDLDQRITLEVQTAFLNLEAALQRIRRAEKALAASRAELELAEKRYQAGLTNIVELEDAQRYYTYDDAAYAAALYGFSVARAALDRTVGRPFS